MKKKLSKLFGIFFIFVMGFICTLGINPKNVEVSYAEASKTYSYTVSNHADDENKICVSAGLDDDSFYTLTTDGSNDQISSMAEAISLIQADLPNSTTYASLHFDNFVYITNDTSFSFADFQDTEDFYLTTTGTIYISHLTTDNSLIFADLPYSQYFNLTFAPLYDFYQINTRWNAAGIYVDIDISIAFEENGGTFAENYSPVSTFKYQAKSVSYPTSSSISNPHHTFKGWAGKFTISESESSTLGISAGTYYFDKNTLSSYLNDSNNSDPETIQTYFKSSLDELTSFAGFSSYSYSTSPSTNSENLNMNAILLFVNTLHKTPTFEAVWELNTYTINVVTNCTTYIPSITQKYGTTFELQTLSKTGYTFAGWFEDSSFATPLTDYSVSKNKTIYAKWNINSYTLTIKTDNGDADIISTLNYNETLSLPTPTKAGYTHSGWLNESTGLSLTLTKMPASDLTITATYSLAKFFLYFETNSNISITPIYAYYTSTLTLPTPVREGYTFNGWHTDSNCQNDFTLTEMPNYNLTLYADWRLNYFNLTFYINPTDTHPYASQYIGFNTKLSMPTNPSKSGFKFDGWFTDTACVNLFSETNMPANDVTLYAKWVEKQAVQINTQTQTFDFSNTNIAFSNFSNITGFYVFYNVDGKWTSTAPINAGTYDVKITRTEDDNYSAFETTIKGGLVIKPEVVNYGWLIILLFAVAIIEFGISIVLRVMRKMKLNQAIVFAPQILLLANTIINTSQIALIIVSGVLALAGFVLMVYQIVKLHRTIPLAYYEVHKEEEEGDEFHHKMAHDKTDSTPTFTSQDIEEMLSDSRYFSKRDAERKQQKQQPTFELDVSSSENSNSANENPENG